MAITMEEKTIEEPKVEEEVMTADTSMYDDLIIEEIDFRVETRGLHTTAEDGGMHMPNHEATIRINPDGSEAPLWVVGSRYEVVDHREVIKGFAEALDKAGLQAEVEHKVFGLGCRIYSFFTLDKEYRLAEGKPKARPFFSLMTSHDGSLKLGFTVGARVGSRTYRVSKTVYGAAAKHTKGINIEKTISEIERALNAFLTEVLPMWERMQGAKLSTDDAKKILEDAVKKDVLAKRRADAIDLYTCGTVWDAYTAIVNEVTEIRTKRGTEERTFDRNTKVGEYFRKLAIDPDMTGLERLLS
jgi:hypothetical protein